MPSWSELRSAIVLWEDESCLVVDKPPGLSVMGERHDTDLVTIAADAGEDLRWVNRIDKVTSGAVLLAKSKEAHGALTRQFQQRTVAKSYLAICRPGGFPTRATIDLPLMTAGSGRIRVAADREHIRLDDSRWHVRPEDEHARKHFPSRTECSAIHDDGDTVVVRADPVTGRKHQIRVHLAWVGHAIVGDPLFLRKTDPPEARTYLHSFRVGFRAPSDEEVTVEARPADDFWAPLAGGVVPEDVLDRARAQVH
ncbi:RluA family pseudouridine synthase [Pseudonocardia benzenivorans]|uniref:RNA pseudouridylate synthase n=2 Tax=Pseudonocardia TaxID=1847 RepID=F4CRR5_PSEUX|nr:RluA family pseudouridine synthase [Pseudonocardia dioxanivorans]AEA27282.1 pseudouridine synthase [Pseudonocardia dioxanivorans CB1190]GJF07091.1 RNA pseudouridine synthase [Pseudonocardia sp. D17]